MMEAKSLPPKFSVRAIDYASYIQNRVPHKQLDCMTPFEAWSGHKPNVTHFRIFGSKAWARIPIEKRKALQAQSQECLFVGYSEYSKGYKLINLIINKSFIQRCVQFEEEPLAAVEVGEASSPPKPQEVSKEFVEQLILICLMEMSLLQTLIVLQGQNGQPRHYMQQESQLGIPMTQGGLDLNLRVVCA